MEEISENRLVLQEVLPILEVSTPTVNTAYVYPAPPLESHDILWTSKAIKRFDLIGSPD